MNKKDIFLMIATNYIDLEDFIQGLEITKNKSNPKLVGVWIVSSWESNNFEACRRINNYRDSGKNVLVNLRTDGNTFLLSIQPVDSKGRPAEDPNGKPFAFFLDGEIRVCNPTLPPLVDEKNLNAFRLHLNYADIFVNDLTQLTYLVKLKKQLNLNHNKLSA